MRRALRYRVVEVAVAAVIVAGSLAAGVVVTRPDQPRASAAATTPPHPLLGRGPSPGEVETLSDEQMESALSAHPQLVALRLTLVERYLREGQIEKAETHAHRALAQHPDPEERPAVLKYLGWSTALRGHPVQGAELLEESLGLNPDDSDARWFLANVVLHGLGDVRRATGLLEDLARSPMPAETRGVVEAKLAQARATAPSPGPLPRG